MTANAMLSIKTITSDLKISTYIITGIAVRPTTLITILVIMSVSTFKTDVILFIYLGGLWMLVANCLLA